MTRKRQPKLALPAYTQLAVRVARYEAGADVSLNVHLGRPELAFHNPSEDRVFEHATRLVVVGTATYPDERLGETFELTIRGDGRASSDVGLKLRDMHLRDENRVPRYREYRGRRLPVYQAVYGIATMNRSGRESPWTAWTNLSPSLVSDMLVLLAAERQLYVSIDECKHGRARWIRSLSLQTADPAEE